MKKYRVGIIGMGWIACKAPDNHKKAYEECGQTELVATCDTEKEADYTDYMEMVKLKLDIVSVCTPPETHKEIVCAIAPYVRAIYCEKPISLTLEDAHEMIDTCRKNRVTLQINHQRSFTIPTFRYSRGIIDTGTHMFALILQLFKSGTPINIVRVDTDEHVFELDCTHTKENMILLGVQHLINCLKEKKKSACSGEKGLEALRMALQHKERTGCD